MNDSSASFIQFPTQSPSQSPIRLPALLPPVAPAKSPTSSPPAPPALVFTSCSAEDDHADGGEGGGGDDTGSSNDTGYSPLTPLDFGFSFGNREEVRDVNEVSVWEDDDDDDDGQEVVEVTGQEDEEGDRERRVTSVISLSDVDIDRQTSRSHGGRPMAILPPPSLPLPNPPRSANSPKSQSLTPCSSPRTATNDWTLGLTFNSSTDINATSLEEEKQKDLERMRRDLEEKARDDWTLGLNLTWSAGMLMGDERGDGRGKGGRTRSRVPPQLLKEGKVGVEKGEGTRRRSGSPFPLLECSKGRKLSPRAVDEQDEEADDLDIHRDDSEMEKAFQELLTDAIEGRFSRLGRLGLVEDHHHDPRNSSSSSLCRSERKLSGVPIVAPKPPRSSGEWLTHPIDTVDRRSEGSTGTSPYHSARSSWLKKTSQEC